MSSRPEWGTGKTLPPQKIQIKHMYLYGCWEAQASVFITEDKTAERKERLHVSLHASEIVKMFCNWL